MIKDPDFYTVTMARVYEEQGHLEKAAEIYRYLIKAEPERRELVEKLVEIENKMDEATFKAKLFHAEIMSDVDNRPDYWRGYIRGLRRAYHGESFGTDQEHTLWLSLADRDTEQDQQRGLGYSDGLQAG